MIRGMNSFHNTDKTLKVLFISHIMSGEHFIQLIKIIVENMPNLIEMEIQWLYDFDGQQVIDFMEARTNLKKINVPMDQHTHQLFSNNLLNSQWTIERNFKYPANEKHKTLLRKEIDS